MEPKNFGGKGARARRQSEYTVHDIFYGERDDEADGSASLGAGVVDRILPINGSSLLLFMGVGLIPGDADVVGRVAVDVMWRSLSISFYHYLLPLDAVSSSPLLRGYAEQSRRWCAEEN